jgi:hypothetical protein
MAELSPCKVALSLRTNMAIPPLLCTEWRLNRHVSADRLVGRPYVRPAG